MEEAEEKYEKRKRCDEPCFEDVFEAYCERVRGKVPAEFISHLRTARKELWLAARSLIDARIESLEEEEERKAVRRPQHVKID